MKRILFLLNAAFATAVRDLILHVMLRQLSCYPNSLNIPHSSVVFHVITCTGNGCLIVVFYWNLINYITPMQHPVIIGIKCSGHGSCLERVTLQRLLTAMRHFRMPSPLATHGALVCDEKRRG